MRTDAPLTDELMRRLPILCLKRPSKLPPIVMNALNAIPDSTYYF